MTLIFPTSPSNGDVYENYVWNDSVGAWQLIDKLTNVEVSSSQPTGQVNGQLWFNESDQNLYIFYNSSWISVSA